MHSGGVGARNSAVSAYNKALAEKSESLTPDDVTSVKWRKGKIVYVRGNKSKKMKKTAAKM